MEEGKTPQTAENAIPNFFEIWKALYFTFEDVMTAGLRAVVNTRGYAVNIDMVLNTYLQMSKFYSDLNKEIFAKSPLPSKTDIARVAELVIGVEDKVDNLDSELDTKSLEKGLQELKKDFKENLAGIDDLSTQITKVESTIDSLMVAVKELEKKVAASITTNKKTAKSP